jgi:hypothetical protein
MNDIGNLPDMQLFGTGRSLRVDDRKELVPLQLQRSFDFLNTEDLPSGR